VDVVVEKFGVAFPELKNDPAKVKAIIAHEEALFTRTLDRGLRRFESLTRNLKKGDVLGGADAFLLYGTYGFPLDLIQIMSDERGLKVDLNAFNDMLKRTREDSQNAYAAKKGEGKFMLSAAAVALLQNKGLSPTDDSPKYSRSLDECEAVVRAIWQGNAEHGKFVESLNSAECGIILDRTNFYAEGGGQIFDTGFLSSESLKFNVRDTQAFGGYVVHIGAISSGEIKVGDKVSCTVNNERRGPIMSNHTSTHMVNFALRSLINAKAEQRGSIVSEDRFRFDFDNAGALTRDQLKSLDDFVNSLINQKLPVFIQEVTLEEAKAIRGVRAMFGEQYPNPVRVVSVGADLKEVLLDKANTKWEKFSIEFCGGTHLGNTSEGASFSIVSEEPVSMGVRRIVAVTGDAAQLALTEGERLEKAIVGLSALPDDDKLNTAMLLVQSAVDKATVPAWKRVDLRAKLAVVQERVRVIAKRREEETKNHSAGFLNAVSGKLKANPDQHWVVESLDVGNNNRVLADTGVEIITNAKKELGRDVAVILFSNDPKTKKIYVSATVPEALVAKGLKANEWTAEVCSALGGKGGGSPKGDVAQGNGPNVDSLPAAVEKAKLFATGKL